MEAHGAKRFSWLTVILTSGLLISISFILYEQQRLGLERNIREDELASLTTQAKVLSHWSQIRMAELNVIANTDTIRAGNLDRSLAYIQRELERLQPNYYRLGITDREGRMHLSGGSAVDASQQPGYDEAISGQPFVTPPVRDGVDPNDILVFIRVPYYDADGKEILGIIGASFRLERLFENAFSGRPDSALQRYFIDDNGEAFTIMEQGQAVPLETPPAELVSTVIEQASGVFSYEKDDDRKQVVHAAVEGTSWHLALAVPEQDFFAPVAVLRKEMFAQFIAFELLFLLLIALYYKFFAGRLHSLTSRLARMNHVARHDSLTGLPNRMHLHETLEALIREEPSSSGRLIGLALMDLNRFKVINDTLGHQAGDQCLIQAARILSRELQPGQRLYRLGGDEFVLLFECLDSPEQGEHEVNRLLAVMQEPVEVMGHSFGLSGSVGLSFYPLQAKSSKELLKNADLAMYQAKQSGARASVVFDISMLQADPTASGSI